MQSNYSLFSNQNNNSNGRFTDLVHKLQIMAKKPCLDASLSETLDNFLSKLAEHDKYLQNGIFTTNFGEAALLLQSSVDVYVKKVDVLWDKIVEYQKHIISCQKDLDLEEAEKVEGRRTKYKRKRKRDEDKQNPSENAQTNVSKYSSKDINIFSKACDLDEETVTTWRLINQPEENSENLRTHQTSSDATLFQPRDEVTTQDDDLSTKYNHLRITTVIEEIFNLEDHRLIEDVFGGITRMRIASYVANEFHIQTPNHGHLEKEAYRECLREYIKQFVNTRKKDDCLESVVNLNRHCSVSERTVTRIPSKKLGRISVSDPISHPNSLQNTLISVSTLAQLCARAYLRSGIDACILEEMKNIDVKVSSYTECVAKLRRLSECRSASACASQDEDTVNSDDVRDLLNATIQCLPNSNRTEDDLSVSTHHNVDSNFHDVSCSSDAESDNNSVLESHYNENESGVSENRNRVQDYFTSIIDRPKEPKVIKQKKVLETDVKDSPPRRINRRTLKKLSTGLSVLVKDFEKFYMYNYQREEDEEGIITMNELAESDDDTVTNADDGADSPPSPESGFNDVPDSYLLDQNNENIPNSETSNIISDSGYMSSFSINTPSRVNSINLNETPCENIAQNCDVTLQTENVQQEIETREEATQDEYDEMLPDNMNDLQSLTDQERLDRNVSIWKSFMQPKLKSIGNKSDFDIHEYGFKMIDPLPVGTTKNFGDFVQNLPSSEVARYFISTLQLANTYNVEIGGVQPGQLSNNTFVIKVISKEKHHEKLDAYQAPSEETFKQRLALAQRVNPRVILHSTPVGPPPSKKSRLHLQGKKLTMYY